MLIAAIEMRIDCVFLLSQIECNAVVKKISRKPSRGKQITFGLETAKRSNRRLEQIQLRT
jgi:hypothetical protein